MQQLSLPTPDERLREEILLSGAADWVPWTEIHQMIRTYQLADGEKDTQKLVLGTIRALLEEGLAEIGDMPKPNEPFPAWTPVDVAMQRLHERYIDHYADYQSWCYSIWLGTTPAGAAIGDAMLDDDGRALIGFRPYECRSLDSDAYEHLSIPKGVTVTILGHLDDGNYAVTVSADELRKHGTPAALLARLGEQQSTTRFGDVDFTVTGKDLTSGWRTTDE